MKEFNLKPERDLGVGKGNTTQQILNFLIYDGDATMSVDSLDEKKMVWYSIYEHRLENFLLTRGNKKLVVVKDDCVSK
ncbi:hypothetical protein [Paraliobacillus ryukyuensis]|uniref:hypothetical protein n=1 Tax=Paraliobacillus ryukyuensis TaxID=200904 RepID=UPI0009A7F1E4|nr:hypothetical protein [Paraliobacillus ryukyuensis]